MDFEDFMKTWSKENDVKPDLVSLISNKKFYDHLYKVVEKVNVELSLIEKVRKFIIAKEPFTIENKMMTPTLKIRRFQVIEKYGDELSSLY